MGTYKIGNTVKCVLRLVSSTSDNDLGMQYERQPYTILEGADATLFFGNQNTAAKNINNQANLLHFHQDFPVQLSISNVLLTDKILNLIFLKTEDKFYTQSYNSDSDENSEIYLPTTETAYNVFVYDNQGILEQKIDTLVASSITVKKVNSNYLIIYELKSAHQYLLKSLSNQYFSLDLEIIGNDDDDTNITYLHLDKCGLEIDKNLYFTDRANTVDLKFRIIHESNDYISFVD